MSPETPISILIVDDEPLVRTGLKSILQELSSEFPLARVREAEDGLKAQEILEQDWMDLVFTDMVMPRMDGLALLEWIAEKHPKCRNVVLSCHDDYTYVRGSFNFNVLDYILKYDIDLQIVRGVLLKFLAARQSDVILEDGSSSGRVSAVIIDQIRSWLKPGAFFQFLFFYWGGLKVSVSLPEHMPRIMTIENGEFFLIPSDPATTLLVLQSPEAISRQGLQAFGHMVANRLFAGNPPDFSLLHTPETNRVGFMHGGLPSIGAFRDQAFFCGPGIREFSLTKGRPSHDNIHREISLAKMEIMRLLLENNLSSLRESLQQLGDQFQMFSGISIGEVKSFYLEYFDFILQHYQDTQPDLAKIDSTAFHRGIEGAAYFPLVRTIMDTLLQEISQSLVELPWSGTLSTGMRRALMYIHTHYDSRNLGLAEIAEYLNYSPSYLSRQFKKETSKNIAAYINELRCREARELLRTGKLLIYEIAERVGFHNYNYFSRIYKKIYGLSPNLDSNYPNPTPQG